MQKTDMSLTPKKRLPPEFAWLLVKNRADVEAKTVKGYSPLMIAIFSKNEKLIEFLKQQIRINKEIIEI